MSMQQAVKALFDRYQRHFNNALTSEPDYEAIGGLYA